MLDFAVTMLDGGSATSISYSPWLA